MVKIVNLNPIDIPLFYSNTISAVKLLQTAATAESMQKQTTKHERKTNEKGELNFLLMLAPTHKI